MLFADRIIHTLWKLARAGGAETVTGERVDEIEVQDDRVVVHGRSGALWTARRLALAAGSWSGRWLACLGLDIPLTVTQEQLAYFRVKDDVEVWKENLFETSISVHPEPLSSGSGMGMAPSNLPSLHPSIRFFPFLRFPLFCPFALLTPQSFPPTLPYSRTPVQALYFPCCSSSGTGVIFVIATLDIR